jgi:ribosomal protein S18
MKMNRNTFTLNELLSEDNFIETENLSRFLTEQGKIISHRSSRLTNRQHSKAVKMLKRARVLGLLPFTTSYD